MELITRLIGIRVAVKFNTNEIALLSDIIITILISQTLIF